MSLERKRTTNRTNITAQFVSANTKRFPLTQGGLEIEIKVTVIWENKKNLKILTEKVSVFRFGAIDVRWTVSGRY